MALSPIVDPSMIMLASWAASLLSMPPKSVAGLPTRPVSDWESMAWLLGVSGALPFQPELVTGGLLLLGIQRHQQVGIRGEKLIVEATLTASCIPVLLRGPLIEREVRCRDSDLPQRNPGAPIWHVY
jgi:hypothetical protein